MSVPKSPPTHLLQRLPDGTQARVGDGAAYCGLPERECVRVTTLPRYATCGECVRLWGVEREGMTAATTEGV